MPYLARLLVAGSTPTKRERRHVSHAFEGPPEDKPHEVEAVPRQAQGEEPIKAEPHLLPSVSRTRSLRIRAHLDVFDAQRTKVRLRADDADLGPSPVRSSPAL